MSGRNTIFILIFLILLFFCCENLFKSDDEVKDPRKYTWTVDTLAYPASSQTMMRRIWASSPKDVYTVGHCSDLRGSMWHYDGKKWETVTLCASIGGNITNMDCLTEIHGFSSDDIWAVGGQSYLLGFDSTQHGIYDKSSLIIHYDGSEWNKVNTKGGNILEDVWGSSPDDIWFVGLNGTLFHWDGVSVEKDSLPMYIPPDARPYYNLSITGASHEEVYLLLHAVRKLEERIYENYYMFKRECESWAILDSTYDYLCDIWMSPSGTLYTIGTQIFLYDGTGFIPFFQGYSTIFYMYGLSDENMFAVGKPNTVYHYNGNDWYLFNELQLPDLSWYSGIWTDGREAFIIGRTSGYSGSTLKTIILHGK